MTMYLEYAKASIIFHRKKIGNTLIPQLLRKRYNFSITSSLDSCNSLLYRAKGYKISQLQLCQNNDARMLSLRRKFLITYTGCLLSKESNTRCCCSLIKLSMLKPLHISPSSVSVYSNQAPAIRHQKYPPNTKMPFGRVWQTPLCVCRSNPLESSPYNAPLPLIPSRAAWRLTYLMWHIPRSTDSYIVWVYCLWPF